MRKLGLFLVAIVLAFLGCTDTALAQFVLQSVPASVTFQYQQGGPTPAPEQLNVSSLSGSPIAFTDSVTSGSNLFAVSVSSGTTPATITVSVIASELPLVRGSAVCYVSILPSTGLVLLVQVNLAFTAAATCPAETPEDRDALQFTVPDYVTSALPAGPGTLTVGNDSESTTFSALGLDRGFISSSIATEIPVQYQ